jgi:hypothetical protein
VTLTLITFYLARFKTALIIEAVALVTALVLTGYIVHDVRHRELIDTEIVTLKAKNTALQATLNARSAGKGRRPAMRAKASSPTMWDKAAHDQRGWPHRSRDHHRSRCELDSPCRK